jgi:hypothetical protein
MKHRETVGGKTRRIWKKLVEYAGESEKESREEKKEKTS